MMMSVQLLDRMDRTLENTLAKFISQGHRRFFRRLQVLIWRMNGRD